MPPKSALAKLIQINRYLEYMRLIWWRTVLPWKLRRAGVNVHSTARFLGAPIVSKSPLSQIIIGPSCLICSVSIVYRLGVNHPVILRTMKDGATIRIGEDTGMSGTAICSMISVEIGARCMLEANTVIADNDFHPISPKNRRYNTRLNDIDAAPVTIGSDVFVGTGAIIMKGVTIGDGSVIGAGSIVTGDIPAYCIAAGNPARPIRNIPSKVTA